MNNRSNTIFAALFISSAMLVGGCYTQLMTPQEFVQTKRGQGAKSIANNSYALNYNQSCVTCHSVSELNERAEEMEYYGVRTVHDGYLLSSRDWMNLPFGGPINIPDTGPYWPSPTAPTIPWWTPTVVSVPSNTQSPQAPVERRRTGGAVSTPTPSPKKQEENIPVYTAPAPKVNTEPATTAPASTPSVNSNPAPAPANDSGNDGRRKKIPD